MAISWQLFLFQIIFTNHLIASDGGHFMVLIDSHLSFILCSITQEEYRNSELKLININDVVDNELCAESSRFDLKRQQLLFENTNALKLIKINKTRSHKKKKKMIQLQSVSGDDGIENYHFKFQDLFISITLTPLLTETSQPALILSDKHQLNFTWIPFDKSPFTKNKFKTHAHKDALDDIDKIHSFPLIGKRVKIKNTFGVIANHMNNKSYLIHFDDGSVEYFDNIHFGDVHVEYAIGSAVDSFWPPDRLKLTNLADVLWPATILNYSSASDSYTIRYDDGTVHPNIPSIYIFYPQKACVDDRNDCPILAKNEQCRLNPSYAMIHCRKSCRVCTANDNENESKIKTENGDQVYFNLKMISDDDKIIYQQDKTLNSFDEARALNEIGEKLMLYGNVSMAEEYFLRASWLGNNLAKFNLGHLYTVKDDAKEDMAVLYLYFSALGGDLSSNLALGYRHLYGFGVPKSCQVAAKYYQKAGNTLFGNTVFNPMQQQHIEMIRLHDVNRRDTPITETDEVIRFYHTHADNGDANAQMALGQLYYYGLRGFQQDFDAAIHYFTLAASNKHGDAYAMLGNIYVDGIDALNIKKNVTKAIEYYKKAISAKSVAGYTGMAFLYLEGIPHKNTTAAFEHFKYAAKRQDLSALFYLGLMYFNGIGVKQKSLNEAFECFMMASRRGHAQSLYYAGYMHLNGLVATAKSCKMAVELFKMAAERTVVAKQLSVARSFYLDSNYNAAYYLYSKLAIQGFEIAQSNAGWLLKRNLVSKDLFYLAPVAHNDNATAVDLSRKSAFKYFEWSAQTNADSQRIVGDYYYYNYLGTNESEALRYEEAGMFYEMSAENTLGANAQSMFNLGYMHQYGIGKKKDFSMAKRYYDLSASTDPNGNVACYIFLALLYIERFIQDAQYHNNLHYFKYNFMSYDDYNLNVENTALLILIVILIIVLWIRR